MNPTQEIITKGGLTLQPEFQNAKYLMYDEGGIEAECGEFLYGLIRLLKPERILETGTRKGIASAYMGLGLKKNGIGELDTIEFAPEHWPVAKDLWKKLEIDSLITLHEKKVEDFDPEPNFKGSDLSSSDYMEKERRKYDVAFLDTEPDLRFKELVRFFPYVKHGGFIIIHDLHSHMSQTKAPGQPFAWPFGKLPKKIVDWVKDGELRPFHFETQRGMTCFYKSRPGDFKWK